MRVFFLLDAVLDLLCLGGDPRGHRAAAAAAFNVLDTRNRIVWTIADFLYRVTEPAAAPDPRACCRTSAAVDLSPLVLILLLITALQHPAGRDPRRMLRARRVSAG